MTMSVLVSSNRQIKFTHVDVPAECQVTPHLFLLGIKTDFQGRAFPAQPQETTKKYTVSRIKVA
jgi:hypothetical protein